MPINAGLFLQSIRTVFVEQYEPVVYIRKTTIKGIQSINMATMEGIKLGEFTRLATTAKNLSLMAQEVEDGKYSIIAINPDQQKAYYVRHRRHDGERTWRLDRLTAFLKEQGLLKFEVRSLCV